MRAKGKLLIPVPAERPSRNASATLSWWPGLILKYVPLLSRNRAGRIDRGGGAAASGEFAGHDRAVASAAGAGGSLEPRVSRVSAHLRRAAENGQADAPRVG